MNNKDNLGRRIFDLIQENEILLQENEEVLDIEIDKIKPNPQQPRIVFDEKSLEELAHSIEQYGVIQPIIVKQVQDFYYVIAGERRLRASKMAQRATIPALIRDYSAKYYAEMAILENIQRESLTSIEEAIAYKRLLEKTTLTHDQLAKRIGKSRSYITNIIGLLKLPDTIISMVNSGKLSTGHAKILSKLDNKSQIEVFSRQIIDNNLNVRETERLISNHKNNKESVSRELSVLADEIKKSFNLAQNEVIIKDDSIIISLKKNS